MKTRHILLSTVIVSMILLTLPLTTVNASPGTTGIDTAPLFTKTNAQPNIILGIDDSGSMDFEVLLPSNDGALWWNTNAGKRNFEGSQDVAGNATNGVLNYNTAGSANSTWKKFVYLFPNGNTTSDDRVYSGSTNAHFAIPPFITYAYMRSAVFNKAYYDPAVRYNPWANEGTNTYSDISTTTSDAGAKIAPSDPYTGSKTFNLISNIESTSTDYKFKFYHDGMVIPKGTRYYNTALSPDAWDTAASDIALSSDTKLAVSYYPATYYIKVTSGTYTVNDGTGSHAGSCSSLNADHYDYFNARPSTFVPDVANTIDALGPDGTCLKAVKIESGTNSYTSGSNNRTDCATPTDCTYYEELRNFANWFSYYRKRHLAVRAGAGTAFAKQDSIYAGIFTINSTGSYINMLNMATATDKIKFYDALYAKIGKGGGTPNRQALEYVGKQYAKSSSGASNGAPIKYKCQKNFTLFFTDGFTSLGGTLPSPGNTDSDDGKPYADGYSNTFADIARLYYEKNIRPDLAAGEVPVPAECSATNPNPQLDCNKNPHMQTFTLALGASGSIFNQTVAGTDSTGAACNQYYADASSAYACYPAWPNTNSARNRTQIDDLYHAAVNSHADMFNADTPEKLAEVLGNAISSISAQVGNAAAAVAFNTSSLSSNSVLYIARFQTNLWSGDVLAYPINTNGTIDTTNLQWRASEQIPAASSRVILTYNKDTGVDGLGNPLPKLGTGFNVTKITALSATNIIQKDLEKNRTNYKCTAPAVCTLAQRIEYYRGDRTYEDNVAGFRERDPNTILGDIIDSSMIYVGIPAGSYPATAPYPTTTGETYAEFKDLQLTRQAMLYVGANDGMLHGFNATTGTEKIAYIPNVLFSDSANEGLHYLSEPDYKHRFYVDLTPTVSDIYIHGRSTAGQKNASRSWHTILIGSLGAGGEGIFALDVTNPANFSEADMYAQQTVLWEFTSADDSDMGLSYSLPTMAPTNATDGTNLRWAAIMGNGYQSGTVTGGIMDYSTCNAVLYVLFMDGSITDGIWNEGTDYIKIDTKAVTSGRCNGLSTPTLVDTDQNGTVDRVYAGDLAGNLWVFDLCSKTGTSCSSASSGWSVAYGSTTTPLPLFTAKDAAGTAQPISARPRVASHPTVDITASNTPNLLITFGTGKYIEDGDRYGTTDIYTYYTVWDNGTDSLDRSNLLARVLDTSDDGSFRVITNPGDVVDYTGGTPDYGWYIDLSAASGDDAEERVLYEALILNDLKGIKYPIVVFVTAIPSTLTCSRGGSGWFMYADLATGNAPPPVFDFDGNPNSYNPSTAQYGGTDTDTAGHLGDGILGPPRVLNDKIYTSGAGVNTPPTPTSTPGASKKRVGRLNWRELRQN